MSATETTIRHHRFSNQQREMMRKFHFMFDYDNTLGLTERPAFAACCVVINDTLIEKGVSQQYLFTPDSLMKRFVGYSFRKMIIELSAEHGFTFDGGKVETIDGVDYRPELEILVKREEVAVIARLATDIKPTDGVLDLLERIEDCEKSVVSSSAERRVRACLQGAHQERFFKLDRVFSAANYKSSKPEPRVYLEALSALGLDAHQCLAIEDSRTGAQAAISAGITVLGYLGAYPKSEQGHIRKAMRAIGVKSFITNWDQFEQVVTDLAVKRFGVRE
jgi:HAD superfamily hydrolase (TIGR01509 family)